MTRKARTSQIEINFDGLTDSVTNLVGSLILILVLLIGLTTSGSYSNVPPGTVVSQPLEEPLEGTRSVRTLRLQIEELLSQIEQSDAEISSHEEKMRSLRKRGEALLSAAGGG